MMNGFNTDDDYFNLKNQRKLERKKRNNLPEVRSGTNAMRRRAVVYMIESGG